MLRNWFITNIPKKRTVSNSAEKLDEISTVDVPIKMFVSLAVRISNKQMSHILSLIEKKYNVQTSLIELGESTAKNL